MDKKGNLRKTAMILLIAIVLAISSYAFVSNSTNYRASPVVVSGGGTNTSSGSYKNILVTGIITGSAISSNYITKLGFLYASGGITQMLGILFKPPTPENGTIQSATYVQINVSILNAQNLAEVKYNWNGTNYTIFDSSLVLMYNFNNLSSLGENDSKVADVSGHGNDVICGGTNCPAWNSSGKFSGVYKFDGADDYFNAPDSSDFDFGAGNFTIDGWVKMHGPPFSATGGTITTILVNGVNYTVHTFTTTGSSTFNVTGSGTVEYLVVAGGGGASSGGWGNGQAGGGGGGARTGNLELTNGVHTITVGGGGAVNTNGENSSIDSSIVSRGGGSGNYMAGGNDGGSGGGGSTPDGCSNTGGGSGTAGQGYSGGGSWTNCDNQGGGGGGGGASAAGGDGIETRGGNGGDGVSSSISGSSVVYAGGGGGVGASAGSHGSGSGTNRGGGGMSGATTGDSGIVIIRYLTNPVNTLSSQWSNISKGWSLGFLGNSSLAFDYSTNGSNSFTKSVDWALSLNTWYHVAVVRNGSNLTFYVNGIQQGETQNISGATIYNSNSQLAIGSRQDSNGNYSDFFNGSIDELRIFKGNCLDSNTIQQAYMSNLKKINSGNWSLFVNQTKNSTAGLSDGTYTYHAFAKVSNSNQNSTEQRTITIGSIPPMWSNNQTNISGTKIRDTFWVSVNWSSGTALDDVWLSIQNLSGWYNLTKQDTGGANTYVYNTMYIMDMPRGKTFNWTFYANDSSGNINQTDIWSYTVANTIPTAVVLSYPTDGDEFFTNRTPRYNWTSSTDADGDLLQYQIQVSLNSDMSSSLADTNVSTLYYIQPTELDFATYYWRVRANDTVNTSEWSDVSNFTLVKSVVITLPTSTVDFGLMSLNQQEDTEDDTPLPILVRNDGNFMADLLNISANQSIWGSSLGALGTSYFQIKAANSTETGSFNFSSSATSWAPLNNSNPSVIRQLNYQDANDEAEIEINLTVPGDEPPGEKAAYITFYWESSP